MQNAGGEEAGLSRKLFDGLVLFQHRRNGQKQIFQES
jgi:hypothetical protein